MTGARPKIGISRTTVAAKTPKTLRATFFEEFGHGAADHVPLWGAKAGPTGSWPGPQAQTPGAGFRYIKAGLLEGKDNCGWWWCLEADRLTENQWKDLLAALRALRRLEIDPKRNEACYVMARYSDRRSFADARDDFVQLAEVLRAAEGKMRHADGRIVCRDLLRRAEESLEVAQERKPFVGHSGKDLPGRAAVEEAAGHGWPPTAVAALLLLYGLERGSWTSVKKKIARWRN